MKLQFENEPLHFPNHRSYHEQHVRDQHKQHLKDGSYRVATAREVRMGNPLQVEVNANGKLRM